MTETPERGREEAGGGSSPAVPAWFPGWARDLAEVFLAGTSCLFAIHGNVHDLVPVGAGAGDGGRRYLSLTEFLATQLFGRYDLVLTYDVGRGLRPLAGPDRERLGGMHRLLVRYGADPAKLAREPHVVLAAVDHLLNRALLEPASGEERPSVALIVEHAEFVAPAGEAAALSRDRSAQLVTLLNWARSPHFRGQNVAFCLVGERINAMNDRIVRSPHVATVEVPFPPEEARRDFIEHEAEGRPPGLGPYTPKALSRLTAGLTLQNLRTLLALGARAGGLTADRLKREKKRMIERECGGLLEFLSPERGLDALVGAEGAKRRLRHDARFIQEGRLEAVPMGYLLCGAVGTGKSFLAECFSGEVGIPCVKLLNFRSKYVGETESNLEKILTVLRSMGPVAVIIDEADAALGDREATGDAGTSGRVFALIASQMGNTRYRGRILWFLITCRPDLLPIDLKRQGRAEVHIPLFPPGTAQEAGDMIRALGAKNDVPLEEGVPDEDLAARGVGLSGADLEGVLLRAWRRALDQ